MGAIAFNAWGFSQVLEFVLSPNSAHQTASQTRPGTAIHFANAYNIALAETNVQYRSLLQETDFIFVDGAPVVWAARLTGSHTARKWTRIYGPNLMRAALADSGKEDRHFFLGGTEQVLQRLRTAIGATYPQARVVGHYSPPFDEQVAQDEIEQRDRVIAEAAPTHIWVGLGTPKQDYEVVRLAKKHSAKCLAVGAAFDYLSGNIKEAPLMLQSLGLQWLHRLAQEPRRLLTRYMWGNPVFIYSVYRQCTYGREKS